VGTRAGLDAMEKKTLTLAGNRTPAVQPVAVAIPTELLRLILSHYSVQICKTIRSSFILSEQKSKFVFSRLELNRLHSARGLDSSGLTFIPSLMNIGQLLYST
jgi:hypothetical protein